MAKRLCWNAIVKNEGARIERAMKSLLPYIACYVVVDTGSTDDTKEKITTFFKERGIPGEIHDEPFENWSQARNSALNWARKLQPELQWDYLLLMDADMELIVTDPVTFVNSIAGNNGLDMYQQAGSVHYYNRRIVSAKCKGGYVGVTHEYFDAEADGLVAPTIAYFLDHADGANRLEKYKRDIALLRAGLQKEPENARYMFYLANTYADAGMHAKAIRWYNNRVKAGGWDEEVWNSEYKAAHSYLALGNEPVFIQGMLDAYSRRPSRPEPMYDLARFFREKEGKQAAALACAEAVEHLSKSRDGLFVNDYVATVGIKEEIAISAFYVPGKSNKGWRACAELAQSPTNYESAVQTARHNMYYYIPSLGDICPSFTWRRVGFAPPDDWVPMNPCVTDCKGSLVMNVRAVNYRMDEEGRYLIKHTETGEINNENPINTRNYVLHLGKDPMGEGMTTVSECRYDPKDMPVEFPLVIGFEDMRLFCKGDSLYSSSTVRQLHPDGLPEQVLSKLTPIKFGQPILAHQNIKRMLREPRECEKNWSPIVDDALPMLFMWRPGVTINPEGKFVHNNPPNFRTDNLSGSSQVIKWKYGYISVLHIAQPLPHKPHKRYYYHRFIEYDASFKVMRLSLPFYLNEKSIEFVAGLCQHPTKDELVISYGFKDEEARIGTISHTDVEKLLCAS